MSWSEFIIPTKTLSMLDSRKHIGIERMNVPEKTAIAASTLSLTI